ncbi:ATP-dependent helicase HrpB [Thalassomonas sp. M1454]|uniref:ATP-dependent helicase HrpB n=1 Tax=Thalassomonas sp. M1454 TaxID=2594477 RepID=UPI00117F430D|nr:ATP-dependent helicase HrpB [Thalassomonas sp. M1454]TRX53409.1 ATP-dependent helicase HrpB [Thalassomonas sp. M1454]
MTIEPNTLPINTIKQPLLAAIENDTPAIILCAPPGAGKSTNLPLWLLQSERFASQKIIMLQPRRIAAKSVATRLAQQLGEKVGETVGYRMRNDTRVSTNTRLEVVTEGILTRLIQNDNELSDVGLIIFDEFHERSIHADLAFALSLDIQQGLRDDLQLLLMSATLDNDYLTKFLPSAVSLACEGRTFPIEISYSAPSNDRNWRNNAINVIRKNALSEQGSILVFLPGTADIRFVYNALIEQLPNEVDLFALYGDLDIKQQQQAIAPSTAGRRKIVLATNIAETSLTIDGISMVIDSGYEKVARFNQDSLINELSQQKISKASAVQRAGRAGRMQAGKCIRLYANDDFQRRSEHSASEISQADLLPMTIDVANWGVSKFSQLNFLELPAKASEVHNWQTLQALDVVNQQNRLTKHGSLVANFPCHPRFAHMLIKALELVEQHQHSIHALSLACLMAALLEERDIFKREQAEGNCDIRSRLYQLAQNKNKARGIEARIILQATSLAKKLIAVSRSSNLKSFKLSLNDNDWPMTSSGLLLAFAYPERIAITRNKVGSYLCTNGKGAELAENDKLNGEPYLVCAQLHSYQNKLNITLAAPTSEAEIYQHFADHIQESDVLKYDEKQQKITSEKQTRLFSLVLNREISNAVINSETLTQLWCDFIRQKGLNALKFDDKVVNFIKRVRWLNQYFPGLDLPDFSEKSLLAQLEVWLAPYVISIKKLTAVQKLNFSEILNNYLDFEQRKIVKLWAPKVYVSPLGREFVYQYSDQPQPKLALPMQQVYGLTKSPYVANGQVAVLLELLSPAKRPIQVTQDLARFWQGSYKDVQKDMKANYPRHFWPDEPANAKPTNKTKKYMRND